MPDVERAQTGSAIDDDEGIPGTGTPEKRTAGQQHIAQSLFNRATDIFRRVVVLQANGVEISSNSGNALPRECGQSMRDIDRIAEAMVDNFTPIPACESIEAPSSEFPNAATLKTETRRTDPDIFDLWSQLVSAGERLANVTPQAQAEPLDRRSGGSPVLSISDGLQLLRNGRDLVFYIARARTPMPKSTSEFIERCDAYLASGRAPFTPAPLPASIGAASRTFGHEPTLEKSTQCSPWRDTGVCYRRTSQCASLRDFLVLYTARKHTAPSTTMLRQGFRCFCVTLFVTDDEDNRP